TGEVEQQGNHYFGVALYRCARLSNAAHGGQVVLSSATAELVRAALPVGASVRDLGEHWLKDLRQPQHIFQLVAPDFPVNFPPLRPLETTPNSRRVQPARLIGGERGVAPARELLRLPAVRPLPLIGPGGVGKPRLGLEIATGLLREFPHGTFFVELATIVS